MDESRVFETVEEYIDFATSLLPVEWQGEDIFLTIDREAGVLMASKMDAYPLEFRNEDWQEMSSRFTRDEVIRRSNEIVSDLMKMGDIQFASKENNYIPEIGLMKRESY